MRRWTAFLCLTLALAGCGRATAPTVIPTPERGLSGPVPQAAALPVKPPPAVPGLPDLRDAPAAGIVDASTFLMRSAILWNDAEAAWISFNPYVPTTGGRFDPLGRHKPTPQFLLDLDLGALQEGSWTGHSGEKVGAVRGATLCLPKHPPVKDGWALALRIDRVVVRRAGDGRLGYNVTGALALRFRSPDAWIDGAFLAHDVLRDDEVSPGEPTVATPSP